ncbi:MobF family relaxase [Streptomyces tricolor]|uniref:MobF family relaxase n=1 Tax=Streptomyces tricolor TaxID=68277 RepID=UPI003827C482
MMDFELITAGQMYRYYLRQVVVGDGRRPARTPLVQAQEEAGVPAGRWMGRGLAALGLAAGDVITETQLRNLFGEGRHPHADQIEADQLAAGKKPAAARRAGALGRRVKVTGFDLTFRPQPTLTLLWALGDEETRRAIEAAHERAITAVLAWIEDEAAIIRIGAQGVYKVRPVHGLAAARFRHYEARSGMPLLHDHLLLSAKALRPDGKWGSVHSEVLYEHAVAASALYNEIVMMEVCEALGLASEPRTVTAGRRPVMDVAGVPHELIRWIARRSDQIAACRAELEHEYVTAVDDDGEPRFLPVVSERARAKLNRMAAKMTRPPKQKARPLAQLRAWWKVSAILTSGVAADVINSLLQHARAAAAAIRARVAAVVDIALAAVDVAATVFVMNSGGRCHRRHLLAEARRHLALVLRGRRREPGLGEQIVDAALATYCVDISEPKTQRGLLPAYHLYTARWSLADLTSDRQHPTATAPDRQPPADPSAPAGPRPPDLGPEEREIPRVLAGAAVREKLRSTVATRCRAYDVVAHQQAAMAEQLLAPPAADPEHSDQEPKTGRREAIDMTALRALRESRTDVEALDLTAERLRRLQDAFADASRSRADRYAERDDADGSHRQDDQQAHHPQGPAPSRGREAGH